LANICIFDALTLLIGYKVIWPVKTLSITLKSSVLKQAEEETQRNNVRDRINCK